jgi:hypothetical protein
LIVKPKQSFISYQINKNIVLLINAMEKGESVEKLAIKAPISIILIILSNLKTPSEREGMKHNPVQLYIPKIQYRNTHICIINTINVAADETKNIQVPDIPEQESGNCISIYTKYMQTSI